MNTIQNLFQQAQLAEAAYANFGGFANPKDALVDIKFSNAQATDFVAHWRVVDQYTASGLFGLTDGSGFSATVFEKLDANGIGTGQYSFAARGTQVGLLPPTTADLSADLGDIVADGIALDQVVDMYNYWQSLTHSGVYQATKLETSLMETAALNLLLPGAALRRLGDEK